MGDEDDGDIKIGTQILKQLENLRLHGDIQRGGWLIGDEYLRISDQRHGNHHSLTHAPGEFMRI